MPVIPNSADTAVASLSFSALEPTVGTSALKLSEATAVSTEFGMTGKICLTPDQCPTMNEGLSPSVEEIAWAKEHGACAVFMRGTENGLMLSDPHFHPLYAQAAQLNLPVWKSLT